MCPIEAHQYLWVNGARLCACFYANVIANAWPYCPWEKIDQDFTNITL